jgi:hypothetical protein
MAWFHDLEDKKRADIEAAKMNEKVGSIEAKFSQIELTGEIVANTAAPIEQSQGAKKKAGGSDMPTVGISAGRAIAGAQSSTLQKIRTLQTFGSLFLYCKPAKAIKMLKAAHDGVPVEEENEEEEEEEAAPAAAAPAPVAGKKKREAIEIDLTNDDSDSDDEEFLQQLAAASNKRVKAEATG